ncbi:MAG: glycosyltransferase family 39 protein [Planctomycetota bacterium]|nr:glycosyltransferase family 39 protein [Planctomycetota bacterium]
MKLSNCLTNSYNRHISFLFLGALIIRVYFGSYNTVIEGDSIGYLSSAKDFVNFRFMGNQPYFCLYSVIVGLANIVVHNFEKAGQITSIIASSLTVIPLYFLSYRLFNTSIAVIACILFIFEPTLIDYATKIGTESLYHLLVATAFCALVYGIQSSKARYLFFAGLFSGCAYATRTEGLLYGISIIFLAIAIILLKENPQYSLSFNSINRIFYIACGFITIALAFQTVYFFYTGELSILRKSSLAFQMANYISPNLFIRYLKNAFYLFTQQIPDVLPYPIMIIAGVGLFRKAWDKKDLIKYTFIFVAIFTPLLTLPLVLSVTRHITVILPFFLILASIGILEISEWLVSSINKLQHIRRTIVITGITASLLVIMSVMKMDIWVGMIKDDEAEFKAAGQFIKNHTTWQKSKVFGIGIVSYYAEAENVDIPFKILLSDGRTQTGYSAEELLNYIKEKDVDYLVVSERCLFSEQFRYLLTSTTFPDNFKLVFAKDSYPHIRVFEIVK